MSEPGAVPDLLATVREIERYAAEAGWDAPPRLFALVATADLLAHEPGLADSLTGAGPYTPVEQDDLPAGKDLETLLATISWPGEVAGVAVSVERVMLPPEAERALPEGDAAALAAAVQAQPAREDVRLVAAVLRDGTRECAVRLRSHDVEADVLTGPDLVPALTDALLATLA